MNFAKSTFYTAISSIIVFISGFFINKIIAGNIGIVGFGRIGQLRDFISILFSFSNGGISQGVVKYTSEYKLDREKIASLFFTSLVVSIFCSLIIGIAFVSFSTLIIEKIFISDEFNILFVIIPISLVLYSINALLISFINGLKEIKIYVLLSAISSVFGLVATFLLIQSFKIKGAIIAISINQSIAIGITFLFFLKVKPKGKYFNYANFDTDILIRLLKFSLLFILTPLIISGTSMLLRNQISSKLSMESSGLWESMNRLSSMYMLIITTSFNVYLIPTFSKLKSDLLKNEIFKTWKIVIPITFFFTFIIFLFKNQIVSFAFAEKFKPMTVLFKYQLLGDIIKIPSWVLSNLLIAKAKINVLLFLQIFWSFSYIILNNYLISKYGLEGSSLAYFFSYVVYFLFLLVYFRKLLFFK